MKLNQQQLLTQLGGLPGEREPSRDLWPGIQQRIAPSTTGSGRRKPWFYAVAAALVMGLSLTLGMRLGRENAAFDADQALAATPLQTFEGRFYAALLDIEYAGALRDVAGQFRADPLGLPDREDVVLSQSLKVLQRATEDLRDALDENPSSIFLADLLASTHRKRMDLLRGVALARFDTTELNGWKT